MAYRDHDRRQARRMEQAAWAHKRATEKTYEQWLAEGNRPILPIV